MSFGGINTFQQYTNDLGIGNNGVKITFNYFDGLPEPSLLNALNSNDLKLLFKSLTKRDDITKEKALTDLTNLITKENVELGIFDDIFLLCWSQIYSKLITNESKSIRYQSHLISITLIKMLNKKVNKFLKDLIPLYLMGTCDTDLLVSKNCTKELLECFNNDQKKIDTLWIAFYEQILNVCKQVIVIEEIDTLSDERYTTKEESDFKYNRMLTESVNLIILLLKSHPDKIEEYAETYYDILSSEGLWKNINLNSFHHAKLFEILLELTIILYDIKYLKKNKDILKMIVRRLFKAIPTVSSKNVIKFNTVIPLILNTFSILDHYKDGRIWNYDKNSKDKIVKLLSVSVEQPVPGFFSAMDTLFRKTMTHSLLDYTVDWLPLWQKALKLLNEKQYLGKFGAQLIQELWIYYLSFLEQSSIELQKTLIHSGIINTLKSNISLKQLPALGQLFSKHVSAEDIVNNVKLACNNEDEYGQPVTKVGKHYLNNLVILLFQIPGNESAVNKLAAWALETISNDSLTVLNDKPQILDIFVSFIESGKDCLKDEISKFIYEIPVWLEESTYDKLSNIIIKYSSSIFIDLNEDWLTCLEDFFMSVFSTRIANDKVIYTLDHLNSRILKEFLTSSNALEVNAFISTYLKTYTYEDNGLFLKGNLLKKSDIPQLYTSTKANEKSETLYLLFPELDKDIQKGFLDSTSFFLDTLSSGLLDTHEQIKNIVLSLSKENDDLAQKLAKSVTDYISYSKSTPDMIQLTFELINSNINALEIIIPLYLDDLFLRKVPYIDYKCSLSNPLGINAYLLSPSSQTNNNTEVESLIRYGLFLDKILQKFPEYLNNRCIVFLSLISELVNDYNYISETPKDEFYDLANTVFKNEEVPIDFFDILNNMLQESKEEPESVVGILLTQTSPVLTYFKSRILYRILINEIDVASRSTIAEVIPKIEKFVSSTVRAKESTDCMYFKSAVILAVLNSIGADDSLKKLRTLLSSECIGVRPVELVNKTYKVVILLNNLLSFEGTEIEESFVPIAPQRLTMILKNITQWLDSDIAYDEEFAITRIALLKLFKSLLSISCIRFMGNTVIDIGTRLLTDSLSICELDETPFLFELRLQCLQLVKVMNRFGLITEQANVEDINEMLIEMSLHNYSAEQDNQISSYFYKEITRHLLNIKPAYLSNSYDKFVSAYTDNGSSKNINQTRLVLSLLMMLVYNKQQEKVIEFELQQQTITQSTDEIHDHRDDEEENLDGYKLPTELIDFLSKDVPQEYLEYENEQNFIKYLWHWVLALRYFKDVSYKMRQLYIEQFKEHDLINKMFDFITDQIDLDDKEFWKNIPESEIRLYNPTDSDFSPYKEDIVVECRKLLGHLLYELFNNVGSLTSNWFLNIRSRSHQQAIDKFVSVYISPILIKDELDKVEGKIDYLTSKDDDLTIKINRITNEAKASYLIDEQKLEISFKLPSNYPLSNVQVIGVSRVGISEQKWKQWIMSTQHVITGMNGSVLDSLELFTKNVHLQFSGFEECAICYSILHAVDRKLPNKTCPTCKNKFHGACLYKWFRSSGNNTCPLCRTEIPFRR